MKYYITLFLLQTIISIFCTLVLRVLSNNFSYQFFKSDITEKKAFNNIQYKSIHEILSVLKVGASGFNNRVLAEDLWKKIIK